jgi:hypothetical protein
LSGGIGGAWGSQLLRCAINELMEFLPRVKPDGSAKLLLLKAFSVQQGRFGYASTWSLSGNAVQARAISGRESSIG